MHGDREQQDLLRLLPAIRRARLWRLYAEDGRRFLDLWMDGGRAILGSKGSGIGTVVKAAVDVGLSKPMPSVRERRLEKELLARYPLFSAARFYRDDGRARAALERAFGDDAIYDPARRGEAGPSARAIVLRPFAEALSEPGSKAGGDFPAAFPLIPCPAPFAPAVLLFRDNSSAELAGGDLVAPLYLAAASRALAEFATFSEAYNEEHWRRTDRRLSGHFERRGPWLYALPGTAGHAAFFRAALASGVLVSPDPELPCLVPGDFDDGELARLRAGLDGMEV